MVTAVDNGSRSFKWVLVRIAVPAHRKIKAMAAKKGIPLRDFVASVLTKLGK